MTKTPLEFAAEEWKSELSRAGTFSLPIQTITHELLNSTQLRPTIIEGLLRQGESMNLIAPPKVGKSWLVHDLAITIATGGTWLGRFPCSLGRVLLLDLELHPETLLNRIKTLLRAKEVSPEMIKTNLDLATLRGKGLDLDAIDRAIGDVTSNGYFAIVIDALYRTLPKGIDENSNADMTALYNTIDSIASKSGAAIVIVHHASKGGQGHKALTDVGAGAGAIARAADTHLILREHQEPDAVVVDAACRSFPRPTPWCMTWAYPLWTLNPDLDPALLKTPQNGRPKEKNEEWNSARFALECLSATPKPEVEVMREAKARSLSGRQAKALLQGALGTGNAFNHRKGRNTPALHANVPIPESQSSET